MFQGSHMPNMKLVHLKGKELLRYYCNFHWNQVAVAVKYAADSYYPKETWCQIWTLYDLNWMSFKGISLVAMVI